MIQNQKFYLIMDYNCHLLDHLLTSYAPTCGVYNLPSINTDFGSAF